ncbi:hypothetical protein [Gordonia sp. UBA5067]|uniref:hypothetical protein n=1 Tax=Gordonia sp. UBA5067 TaxID=1946575 RepID=UPI0025C00EFC|nr:hypothetical protein [Gordonia sp. UBA5067]
MPPPQHGQSGPGDRRQWSPPAAGQPQSPGRHEVGGQFGAGAGQYGPAATGFNDPQVPAVASSITMSAPPNGLLIVAAACAGAGGLIGALGWGRWWSLLGWLLAGPIAIWLVARFVAVDTERKTATVYSRPGSTGVLWAVAIVLTVLGIAVTALAVGFWIGRL